MAERDLLPDNTTPLMRELAGTSITIDAIKADIVETLWNPWTIPEHLLRDLASWLSIDFWQDSWSENTKRQMIAQSPEYHAIKGTPRAIEMALSFLGYSVAVLHWWQVGGRRGTFKVLLQLTGAENLRMPELNATNLAQIFAAVTRAKPKSRAFSVDVGIGYQGGSTAFCASRALEIPDYQATAGRAGNFAGSAIVACASRALELINYSCEVRYV
jgi:phage tail P2-like protein